jgi:hypothetical protein
MSPFTRAFPVGGGPARAVTANQTKRGTAMSEPTPAKSEVVQVPLRAAPNAPEIYVDGYQGATYKDGVIKLNFYSTILDPASNATYNEVVMRLALTVNAVAQIHAALGQLVGDLERKGVVRRG